MPQCPICLPPFSTLVSKRMILNSVRTLPLYQLSTILAALLTCGHIRLPWRCFLNWHVSGTSDVTDGINTLGITPGCKHQKELFHLPTCHIQLCRVESPERGKSMPLAMRTREQSFDASSPFCVNLSILSLTRCSLTSYAFPTSHLNNLSDLFLIPQTHRKIYIKVLTIWCSCDNIWCRVLLCRHRCSGTLGINSKFCVCVISTFAFLVSRSLNSRPTIMPFSTSPQTLDKYLRAASHQHTFTWDGAKLALKSWL